MKVLIAGRDGQLGGELLRTPPAEAEIRAFDVGDCDIASETACRQFVGDASPDLIVNAAAFTAVDAAESEREAAHRVNALGVRHLAAAARACRARVIHVSTDFVFDGESAHPYRPDAPVNPLGAYGATKAEGERELMRLCPDQSLIIRTSWLYSALGRNFVKTMLRLMSEPRPVRVVCDQIGAPTWARGLAGLIWDLASRREVSGIYHWSDAGVASWYDFACAIRDEARVLGLLGEAPEVIPIATAEYPTPARRPAFSVLDSSATWALVGYRAPHWRDNLREMLQELKAARDA